MGNKHSHNLAVNNTIVAHLKVILQVNLFLHKTEKVGFFYKQRRNLQVHQRHALLLLAHTTARK